jgi:F-type H+-transporting ATPase subunit b
MTPCFLSFVVQNGSQIETIAKTFGVDWPHLLAQVISFSIVCVLLYWWAYQPILKMLAARRKQIEEAIANAQRVKAELAQTEAQRQEVIVRAHGEADRIIQEAHAAAARVRERETQNAIAAAEQILVNSRVAVAQEHAQMLAELKREVGRLVVETAAAVTGKVLTAEDQRHLAEETAKQLLS